MKTIAHVSDLHFGTELPRLADRLVEQLQAASPTLLVVSGDLTQRAREAQYAAARAYLDRLPRPRLVVPGNHDVPLYDVGRRFFSPLGRYRRHIDPVVDPVYQDDELCVAGINTARSFTWQNGAISSEQLAGLARTFAGAGGRFKVVVTHHPFIPPPAELNVGANLVGGGEKALRLFDQFDVDLLLAGHFHHGYAGATRAYYPSVKRSVVAVQAGTAISHRTRAEPNAYNWITLDRAKIVIEARVWNGDAFVRARETVYVLQGSAWVPVVAVDGVGAKA